MPISIAEAAGLGYVYTRDVPIVREVNLAVQAGRPAMPALQAVIDSLTAHDWGPAIAS
jgi:hypothetical protein